MSNILGGYCVGCGEYISGKEMIKVDSPNSPVPNIVWQVTKTPCCKGDVINKMDAGWDCYGEESDPQGERWECKNFQALVKLCIAIGKSPFAIWRGGQGYYIDIKAKRFLDRLEQYWTKAGLLEGKDKTVREIPASDKA